jgi:hypothetical protein
MFTISSAAFEANGTIPTDYTCSGADKSPPLAWSGAPGGAASFALVCEDPDAPGGTFYHWGVYNLSADLQGLEEGASLPKGAKTVRNSFGTMGYRGPCPPKGHGTHHYHFRLIALSVPEFDLSERTDCKALLAALRPHTIGSVEIVGTFSR